MMLRERLVPPQPGGPFQLNKKFPPLSTLNIKIATKAVPLKPSPRGDRKIKALVNSFDASVRTNRLRTSNAVGELLG